eukprot:gb/GECH01004105.1/.p1 GENE.gb/GECH01004105.1/~~gb/GECH01004105.1/.p1  ORF type:complete len:234 (+),score=24.16 gb/GECH01004105.1/:1-702(+)
MLLIHMCHGKGHISYIHKIMITRNQISILNTSNDQPYENVQLFEDSETEQNQPPTVEIETGKSVHQNTVEQSENVYVLISRPWYWFTMGMLSILPIMLCAGAFLLWLGHTRYTSFDIDKKKVFYRQFRSMCCAFMGRKEVERDYSQVDSIRVGEIPRENSNSLAEPKGEISLWFKDKTYLDILSDTEEGIETVYDTAQEIREFTGFSISLNTDWFRKKAFIEEMKNDRPREAS